MKRKTKTGQSATAQNAEPQSPAKTLQAKAAQNAAAKPTTPTLDKRLTETENKLAQIEKALANLVPKIESIHKTMTQAKAKGPNPIPKQLPEPPKGKTGLPISEDMITKGLGLAEKIFAQPETPKVDPITKAMMDVQKDAFISHWKNFLKERDLYVQLGEGLVKHIGKHGWKGVIKLEE